MNATISFMNQFLPIGFLLLLLLFYFALKGEKNHTYIHIYHAYSSICICVCIYIYCPQAKHIHCLCILNRANFQWKIGYVTCISFFLKLCHTFCSFHWKKTFRTGALHLWLIKKVFFFMTIGLRPQYSSWHDTFHVTMYFGILMKAICWIVEITEK